MKNPQIYWTEGSPATLEDILSRREARSERQIQLLKKYHNTLICFTLNIAGPIKYSPLIRQTFQYGTQEIEYRLKELHVKRFHYEEIHGGSGCTAFFSIQGDPLLIKKWMTEIEDTHPIGRLFDIDVLTDGGIKVSREQLNLGQRKCLLCGEPAFLCGRSRRHSAEELKARQDQMMWNYYTNLQADMIGAWFIKAMMYEVTTTPKPGLVDRWHNGAHQDMNIDLFMESIYSLQPYFRQCAFLGLTHGTDDLPALFDRLRHLGLESEQTMLNATGGVNTHKGLIFSGGILCGAMGYSLSCSTEKNLYKLGSICQNMLVHLLDDYKNIENKPWHSHGEKLYLKYNITGIRGEAAAGFPIVLERLYPEFRKLIRSGTGLYKSGRIILIFLIAYSEDTNIIHRSDYETYTLIQYNLKKYLTEHLSDFDEYDLIRRLDDYFIRKNISPGGSADLLALVYFLHFSGY